MAKDRTHPGQPVRITTAATNRAEDVAARQKRYLISMLIRTVCVIGAAISGAAGITWLWPILIVAAVILPYVAVIEANVADTRNDAYDLPDTGYRPELGNAPREDQS